MKRALIEAALGIIEAEGPGALTFRKLAERLKVSHAAPLAHFPDRPSLDAAIAARCFSRLETRLASSEPTASALQLPTTRRSAPAAFVAETRSYGRGVPARRLVAMSLAYIRFAIEHPGLYRAMYAPELTANLHSAELASPFGELLREKEQVFKLFADLVEEGQRGGDFRQGLPAEQIARLFLGLAEGLARQYLEQQPTSTGDRLKDAEQLFELLLQAIGSEPGRRLPAG
ncbi:MAG TPA: TetR/AcrR family transcriptional regulator [Gemmatimonadales bacterium]|nr:TetR/AcrR family transcriptional regulator [Gemmatimonadales bacterium]